MNEIFALLPGCENTALDSNTSNYCGEYHLSPLSYILEIEESGDIKMVYSWLGEMEICNDQYGATNYSCGWVITLIDQPGISNQLNFLVADDGAGSAAASGICVREQ